MSEFIKWENTARLFRDAVITEKLDGTNACVIFEEIEESGQLPTSLIRTLTYGDRMYAAYAQSRNRLITPSNDNAGFAKWVESNANRLFYVLGEGRHYGEWWGAGVGRKYGMDRKVFSVFNTAGWYKVDEGTPGEDSRSKRAYIAGINIEAVPVLFQGQFSEDTIRDCARQLKLHGSYATHKYTGEYFSNPEGICVYHKDADRVFKYTLDGNDKHKWELGTPTVNRTFLDKLLRRK